MLSRLIDFSLQNRFLIIVLVAFTAAAGVYSALVIPIDAVPDMTNIQVQVVTESPGLSPLEIERYVTYPVETTMSGLPRVEETRSVSKFGLSVVTIVFEEGVDIYRARQMVNERLGEARSRLAGRGSPALGVLTTALGEVLQFEVRGRGYTPMELRTMLEWQIAPLLRETPGVTEINSHGGYYKTFEARIDPDRLAVFHLSLEDVLGALSKNNASAGGGYIAHHGEQRFIRGQSLLKNVSDIEQVVVKSNAAGAPVLLRDLADVVVAPMTRQGAVTRDGRGEVVTGMVMMLRGENSRVVVDNAKQRIEEIASVLPPGVKIEIIYDRAHLIERTLHTVLHNLLEGGVLVVVILLFLLGSIRAGLVVAAAIPLSMLFATNLMYVTAVSASLMSLGAIDFGLVVDSSVIMIENCMRRLAENHVGRPKWEVVRDAAIEVRKPTMFGELIIAIVYLPILTLQGMEGKLFHPMALTVLFALAGSLVLSLTLMPVLASLALPSKPVDHEPFVIRWVKWFYRPLVKIAVGRPVLVALAAGGLVALSVPTALHLGGEFMPRLDEGDVLIECVRLPSATLEDSIGTSTQMETILRTLPEVKTVFCKTGRPEIANDVMGVHQTDVWVMLKDHEQWPDPHKSHETLVAEMEAKLLPAVPGVALGFSQPIEMRVNELVAGVKADVAVLLYGDDLEVLAAKSREITNILRTINGAADVKSEYQANVPTLTIEAQPEKLARYGITGDQVMQAVGVLGGEEVGYVYEGRVRHPIIARFPQHWRESRNYLEQVPVAVVGGEPIPLAEVADLKDEETPPSVEHESSRRRTYVSANVRNRDIAGFVHDAQAAIHEKLTLPPGYVIRWGGDFENLQSASQRLVLITPVVLLLIWMLLYSTFNSVSLAMLVFLAVPIAASGGVFALWFRGMPFSISAGVGFIALFGVAVLNGLVWVSGAEHARGTLIDPRLAANETALVRIRPVLMTALVAAFGFLPMALSTTAGAEIQRPLATVVIGGLVTATLLTAFVVPAIYPWFAPTEPPSDSIGAH